MCHPVVFCLTWDFYMRFFNVHKQETEKAKNNTLGIMAYNYIFLKKGGRSFNCWCATVHAEGNNNCKRLRSTRTRTVQHRLIFQKTIHFPEHRLNCMWWLETSFSLHSAFMAFHSRKLATHTVRARRPPSSAKTRKGVNRWLGPEPSSQGRAGLARPI